MPTLFPMPLPHCLLLGVFLFTFPLNAQPPRPPLVLPPDTEEPIRVPVPEYPGEESPSQQRRLTVPPIEYVEEKFATPRKQFDSSGTEDERKWWNDIPNRLELPEDEVKTYVIDMKTYKVVRTFAAFRDYWSDLDIVLTESTRLVPVPVVKEANDEAKEAVLALPPPRSPIVYSDITLWNRLTGEKIRTVTIEGCLSLQNIIHRKVVFPSRTTYQTTDVIDLVTGKPLDTLPGDIRRAWNEESFLVLQGKNDVSFLDAKTLEPFCTAPGYWDQSAGIKQRFVTSHEGGTVYEFKTGKKINTLPKVVVLRGEERVFNPDCTKVLYRTSPSEIGIWDVDTGEKNWSAPFMGKDGNTYYFRFSADGQFVIGQSILMLPPSSYQDMRTYVWSVQTGKELTNLDSFPTGLGKVNRLLGVLRSDDRQSKKYALCELSTGKVIADTITGQFAASSKDEKLFLTIESKKLSLWESETGQLIRTFSEPNMGEGTRVTFDSDKSRITATRKYCQIQSRFASYVVSFDSDTGEIIEFEDTLPTDTRCGNITWKVNTDKRHVVFWNVEDGQAIFRISLLPSQQDQNERNNLIQTDYSIDQIHLTPDGNELIFSIRKRETLIGPRH